MPIKIPRPGSHPSPGDLKEFRAAVARLKKDGLIPPNSRGKNVNIRTARPGDSFGGMSLRDRVRRYSEVAEGRAVTLPKSRVKDTQGFRVASKGLGGKDHIIIPVPKSARVSTERGNIVIRYPGEENVTVKRTMLPRKDLKDYLSGAKKLPPLKGKKAGYAFYIYGNKSHEVFENGAQLNRYIRKYKSLRKSRDDGREFFRNLEIVEVSNYGQWRKDARK